MRVYMFIEHYPNPYKPWIDTQVIQMIRAGHDVRIFAEGAFTSTVHDEVREFGLGERTSYYPGTLRGLKRHGVPAVGALLSSPGRRARMARNAADGALTKTALLSVARAMVLPLEPPDVCYIHNLVTASRLTFLRRVYPGAKVCLYFHGGEVGGQPKVRGEAAVFAAVDRVVTSTRFAARQAVERGCDAGKIAVVPLGFHLPGYAPSPQRTYRPAGVLRLVSVGRMSPEKGFIHALRAIRLLLDAGVGGFHYTLVGTGVQYAELRQFAADHRLDDVVRFAGEKTRAEVARELEGADVFILPSIVTEVWAETQATVVQEALLMGCLTITTDAGGVPESNAEEMRTFSVPPADAEAIADRIRRVLDLDVTEIERLGRSGRAFAAAKYDIGPLMDRILAHASARLAADDPAWFVSP